MVNQVITLATDGLKPDLTLFFDLPVELALERTKSRHNENSEAKNRMDDEKKDFYQRVRNAYLELVRLEPQRFAVIDASLTIEKIHTKISETINKFLAAQSKFKAL